MPVPVTDEMMQYMIDQGYIIISCDQDPKLRGSEKLYEFGRIPPSTDTEARHLFFELYRESRKYTLVDGEVYRNTQARHRRRRRK